MKTYVAPTGLGSFNKTLTQGLRPGPRLFRPPGSDWQFARQTRVPQCEELRHGSPAPRDGIRKPSDSSLGKRDSMIPSASGTAHDPSTENALPSPRDSDSFFTSTTVETVGYRLYAPEALGLRRFVRQASPQRKSFAPQAACPIRSLRSEAGPWSRCLFGQVGKIATLYATVPATLSY